jgi:hypothetical protein
MCGRFVGAFSPELLIEEMSEALSKVNIVFAFEKDISLFAPN